ncbi:hypothetical protein PCASD_16526 [Puccinia coronata f. sp. avenae]|uniref:Uncharacterized protein n=1 Tax=Puccinia coronata f. sp. avenae TaxID=200324 RepID=A0A2N5TCM0_9BASI|nr:hypothetical protein PCASD_16526 [Puccinia coronata f. sp. avenae]
MVFNRSEKAKVELDRLCETRNPFSIDQLNYTRGFFEAQWQDQRDFQQTHTNSETEERERLAEYLDRQATLETLRQQLREADEQNPALFESLIETIFEIADNQEQQRSVEINFTSYPVHLLGSNLHLSAERQPLYRGTHIGTTLSTKILAAIKRRKKPIQVAIKKFNGYRTSYLTKFAPDEIDLPENRPLTYHTFANISLDSAFWQDFYLFHSQAPWAKDADVRAGIQAFLIMDRSKEEQTMIKNELNSATSWAVELHSSIIARIDDLKSHPWFQLVNDLPLPPIVGNPDPEDTSNSSINEEDEPENGVQGNEDEVNSALMESMLNVAINDKGNPNRQVGNGKNDLDV